MARELVLPVALFKEFASSVVVQDIEHDTVIVLCMRFKMMRQQRLMRLRLLHRLSLDGLSLSDRSR